LVSLPLINLWDRRSLILHFSLMNIKLRFKGTYLGLIWAVLEPIFMFSILYVVFTSIGETREDFAIYLIIGIMLFQLFSRGTMGGLSSLRDNSVILQSINLRKEFFPVVTTSVTCLFLFVEIGVLFILMPVFGFVPTWTIVFLPLVLLLFLVLILGLSYLLSIIFVFVRDINPLWGVAVYALLFLSPIFWYLDVVEGSILVSIQQINPFGQIIELAHKVIVFGQIPQMEEWLYTTIFVFAILFFSFSIFQRLEKGVVEQI